MNALALLRVQKIGEAPAADLLKENLSHISPEVSITAAYVLLFFNEKEAGRVLGNWLKSENPQWRGLASAALAASGKYGLKLAVKEFPGDARSLREGQPRDGNDRPADASENGVPCDPQSIPRGKKHPLDVGRQQQSAVPVSGSVARQAHRSDPALSGGGRPACPARPAAVLSKLHIPMPRALCGSFCRREPGA